MNTFSPGDEDKLPLQSIYQENVKCAQCPYFTKVRSNMVRHLKIHIKSVEAEGSIVVPSTAPTNPVPCLDTKEKMFDKMVNLAASSQLAQANKDKWEVLSPEEVAKLPHFVPKKMRHKCSSQDCNYFAIDGTMLKHHIKALHDEINVYSCPHCLDSVHVEFRFVPLDKIGQHLKYHDSKLYRCCHCQYFHYNKYIVEKHIHEKHPERRFFIYTVREPKAGFVSEEEHPPPSEPRLKVWKCGLCDDYVNSVRSAVLEHLYKIHSTRSKFKCKYCDMKSSQYSAFASHFASKHSGKTVECIRSYFQVSRSAEAGQNAVSQDSSSDHFDTTPLWQRDAPRVRHIRGILIEEEEVKTRKTKRGSSDIENEVAPQIPSPLDMFFCPLCTDKKKVFRTKSAESFRAHLYQELNYQQYACILCGKMFGDRKECERHHVRSHPNKSPAIKQTKEDSGIRFWVNQVLAKQEIQIEEYKRQSNENDEARQQPKRKKMYVKTNLDLTKKEEEGKKKKNYAKPAPAAVNTESTKARKRTSREALEDSKLPRSTRSSSRVPNTWYKCPHCTKYQSSVLDFIKAHIMLKHLRMGKWLCQLCSDSFLSDKEAARHLKLKHPDEKLGIILNPNGEKKELSDDFWVVEYGFGRKNHWRSSQDGKKTAGALLEQQKPASRDPPSTESRRNGGNMYTCGYCNIEVVDPSSIIEHFERHHKINDVHSGTEGKIYYRCNMCSEKLVDFESLNIHARDKHPNILLHFEIRKIYNCELGGLIFSVCPKCQLQPCGCSAKESVEAPEGSYRCPRCHAISPSYLECIDHLNDHFPRYSCDVCSLRFLSIHEIERHQSESNHKLAYSMTAPSQAVLEEYKTGVTVRRNGVWISLESSLSLDAGATEPKKPKTETETTTEPIEDSTETSLPSC